MYTNLSSVLKQLNKLFYLFVSIKYSSWYVTSLKNAILYQITTYIILNFKTQFILQLKRM